MWWHKQSRHECVCRQSPKASSHWWICLFCPALHTCPFGRYLPQKSRFSSAFVCKSELKTEVLISQLELLCVPDAELDSMKVSFCQIRATDQKAYFMVKLLILCMHACMYIRYKFFLGQHEWDEAMWNERGRINKQNSNVNSWAHERQIMLFVLQRHLEHKHKHRMHSPGQLCFAPEAWNHAQLSRCALPDNRVDHPLCMFVISLQNLYNKTEWCLSVCLSV